MPRGAADSVTSARLHCLWGLPIWHESEQLELIFPAGLTAHTRRGMRLHTGLRDEELVFVDGIPTSDVERTVCELSLRLATDDLVCLVDSARRTGWKVNPHTVLGPKRLLAALALSDPRSESALETHGRLLLSRAGLPPEVLQYELIDDAGRRHGRFDMAWPSARLVVEFDGRAYHEDPSAVRRDRTKANATAIEGWRLLRFTWDDVMRRPAYVIALVRSALFGG